jgi:hypothetical protein
MAGHEQMFPLLFANDWTKNWQSSLDGDFTLHLGGRYALRRIKPGIKKRPNQGRFSVS